MCFHEGLGCLHGQIMTIDLLKVHFLKLVANFKPTLVTDYSTTMLQKILTISVCSVQKELL